MDNVTRLILINQYRILAATDPDDRETWLDRVKVFEHGYESEMNSIVNDISPVVTTRQCEFVHRVLQMYERIEDSVDEAKTAAPEVEGLPWLSFHGFDGNNESEYMGFATYLLRDRKLYSWTRFAAKGSWNSHMPVVAKYGRMLALCEGFETSESLSADQLRALSEA